jgi:hypothetical protein
MALRDPAEAQTILATEEEAPPIARIGILKISQQWRREEEKHCCW